MAGECWRRGAARGASVWPCDLAVSAGQRLRRRGEFQRVYAHGIKVTGRLLVLFFAKGEGGVCRLGITVTRRIGNAVVRNRARRRIRELVRGNGVAMVGLEGELVINARRGIAEAAWQELEEEFARCLGRVRRRLSGDASQ